jgi:hypothetical protein
MVFKLLGELAILAGRIAGQYSKVMITDHLIKGAIRGVSAGLRAIKEAPRNLNTNSGKNLGSAGMTVDEACKILDVSLKTPHSEMLDNFKRFFEMNENSSLYIQSKFVRARQRLEEHFGKSLEEQNKK